MYSVARQQVHKRFQQMSYMTDPVLVRYSCVMLQGRGILTEEAINPAAHTLE